MQRNVDDSLSVVEPSGSAVLFALQSDGSWDASDLYDATLVEHASSFTYTRHGLEIFSFDKPGTYFGTGTRSGLLKWMSTPAIEASTNPAADRTVLSYPTGSTEVDTISSGDRALHVTWNGHRITKVSDDLDAGSGGPRHVDMTYRANGELETYTDALGGVSVFDYDSRHRVTGMRRPGNATAKVVNHYDSKGRVDWQDDELGRRTTFSYDHRSRLRSRNSRVHRRRSGIGGDHGADRLERGRHGQGIPVTNLIVDLAGWYAPSTSSDSGSSLSLVSSPTRVVDTAAGAGTCNGSTCATLAGSSTVDLQVTGTAGVPATATAALVNVGVVSPSAPGLLSVGLNSSATAASGLIVYAAGESGYLSVIVPLDAQGRFAVTTSGSVNVTVDVVGWFSPPVDTWVYQYGIDGTRTAKQETTWGTSATPTQFTYSDNGGLPLLLSQHTGTSTSYLVYGPGGVPIYQIRSDGTAIYYHHDQLDSTRLVTNSAGNQIGAITYTAYGKPTDSTSVWVEGALLKYNGQYTDAETGLVYLRARYLEPASGQFVTEDPLTASTGEPFAYAFANPSTGSDPSGMCGILGDGACNPLGIAGDVRDAGQRHLPSLARASAKITAVGSLVTSGPVAFWNKEWHYDWGSGAAAAFNLGYGGYRAYAGMAIISASAECGPFVGYCSAVGAATAGLGSARFARGTGQAASFVSNPQGTGEACTTGDNLARLARGVAPFGDSGWLDFLGGL